MKAALALMPLAALLLNGAEGRTITYYGTPTETCWGRDTIVKILRGEKFFKGDPGLNKPDPYVKVIIGRQTQQTKYKSDTAFPVWNESFEFRDASSYRMKIEVWDKDPWIMRPDDLLLSQTETLWYPSGHRTLADSQVEYTWNCEEGNEFRFRE